MQSSIAPTAALGAANGDERSLNINFNLHGDITSKKGYLLGAIKPIWLKVLESEQRILWLRKMVEKGLCVRDLQAYIKSEHGKLRSDAFRIQESERGTILGLMRLKLKDEIRNMFALKGVRERVRAKVREKIGKSRGFTNLMKQLKNILKRSYNLAKD